MKTLKWYLKADLVILTKLLLQYKYLMSMITVWFQPIFSAVAKMYINKMAEIEEKVECPACHLVARRV